MLFQEFRKNAVFLFWSVKLGVEAAMFSRFSSFSDLSRNPENSSGIKGL